MVMNSVFNILSNKFWAGHPPHKQKRLFQLLIIWAVIGIFALFLTFYNLIISTSEQCILCDFSLIAVASLGVICSLNGKIVCSLNVIFSIPLFVYAYFISDFNVHPPFYDTLNLSVSILFGGLVFLIFYSRTVTRIKFYFLAGILTLAFQQLKAGSLFESFIVIENLYSNPILVFSVLFGVVYFLRKKQTTIIEKLTSNLNSIQQSVTKVLQDSNMPIAQLKAERDEEGNIVQLTIDKVNNAFESNFKINLYEVQDQKAEYIFNLLFKNEFDVNELIHFKRKRTKEFNAKNLERWFNVHMLVPEYNKFFLIFRDITKIKKQIAELEESKRRYKVLLEAIPDIFFVIDKDGTYEDFVVKESDLFKIEDSNIIGSSIFDVGFPDKMANKIYNCIHSSLKNNSIETIEYSLNTPNGTFLYEMRLAKLSSNSVISVARDITKRKTAEFDLEKALVKAEESDRLKSAFLANLSHEIRTPMNVITNFSRILAETELDSHDKLEITDAIAQNGKQLLNMIDNTIHLSKIETQSVDVNMKFCSINVLLRDIYNRFFPDIPDSKNIKLNLKLNVRNKDFGFVTDNRLLGETLAILVDNAVKYTLQGDITIHYEMIKNEQVRFMISDTGIGIPKEEYEHIFNRFYRLRNNINETTSGSGLGLSIAQHYVEILGGNLEFESTQHVGTKFHFTLPFNEGKGFMMLVS